MNKLGEILLAIGGVLIFLLIFGCIAYGAYIGTWFIVNYDSSRHASSDLRSMIFLAVGCWAVMFLLVGVILKEMK